MRGNPRVNTTRRVHRSPATGRARVASKGGGTRSSPSVSLSARAAAADRAARSNPRSPAVARGTARYPSTVRASGSARTNNARSPSARASPAKAETPSPQRGQVPLEYDKFEVSPNALASCQKCRTKINKGCKRVGKRARSIYGYTYKYYHSLCYPNKSNLVLPGGRTPEQELQHAVSQSRQNEKLLLKRDDLRETLREFRKQFAAKVGFQGRLFAVFPDATLNELIVNLPRNKSSMLKVKGIGPKRYDAFGESIIEIINVYCGGGRSTVRKAQGNQEKVSMSRRGGNQDGGSIVRRGGSKAENRHGGGSGGCDDDDEIVAVESFSVADVIERRFAEAAARGEIITLDFD